MRVPACRCHAANVVIEALRSDLVTAPEVANLPAWRMLYVSSSLASTARTKRARHEEDEMKARWFALLAMVALLAIAAQPTMAAPTGPGYGGGTGICPNPNAPDADGDGIPNGQDPDYVRPGGAVGQRGSNNPLSLLLQYKWRWMVGNPFTFGAIALPAGYGPGDGTGNGGDGPQDGTGYGPGPNGDGTCDGTGGHGYMRGPRD